jgi:hypothetical protein
VLKAELRRLEQQEAGARAALAEIGDEMDRYRQAISILESGTSVRQPAPNHRVVAQPTANGITQLESAKKALRAAGHPLPVAHLLARMVAADFPGKDPKKLRQSVTKTLDRQVKRGHLRKPEPGVYAFPKESSNGIADSNDG